MPLWLLVLLIAVLPRLFRILYPYAWFEDSVYLYQAFAYRSGLKPFIHTLSVHPPCLEYLLAGLYNIFGVSYRVAEILTAIIVTISTLLLFDIARRLFGRYIALFMIVLFSFSSLLFRYHIFEREIFTLFITCLVMWLIVSRSSQPLNWFLIGLLSGLGGSIKLSGLFILPAVTIYFVAEKRFKAILYLLSGFLIITIVLYGYFLITYQTPAFYQIFYFHFFKGYDTAINVRFLDPFLISLNYLWILGASGIILCFFSANKFLIFPLVLFLEYSLFFLFVSSTCWPHNMIDLLLPLAITNGLTIYCLKNRSWRKKNIVLSSLSVILAVFFISAGSLNFSYYQGFGYIPRQEVKKCAEMIKFQTPPHMPVHTPNYLALEAHRLKLIDYEECIGPYRLMLKIIKGKNNLSLKDIKFSGWHELIKETLRLWRYEIDEAVRERRISCVVWDKIFPEWALMYNIDKYLESEIKIFSGSGYRVIYDSPYYTVWVINQH
ncbi:MAG: glycosyltransferase family 39 protein [candidate division WOR-3 bacterium]